MTIAPHDEAVRFTQELIRFDTRNNCAREDLAAQWVRAKLAHVGISVQNFVSPGGHPNLVATIPGSNPDLPALLIHSHLDTVPAVEENWSHYPLSGDIAVDSDGFECIWGRGAADMKEMTAMTLAAVRSLLSSSDFEFKRTLKLIFFADEENGGIEGSDWLVRAHPEVFDGVGMVVSETGGFGEVLEHIEGKPRAYFVQTGEKSAQWYSVTAHGVQSHGSQVSHANATAALGEFIYKVSHHEWNIAVAPTSKALMNGLRQLENDSQISDEDIIADTGFARPWIESSVRNTINPTALKAGNAVNIIPESASVLLDARAVPGEESRVDNFIRSTAQEVADTYEGIRIEVEETFHGDGYACETSGTLMSAISDTIHTLDPAACVLPFLSCGGTDTNVIYQMNPHIEAVGFIPLRIPEGFDYIANFHGIDERVPVESVRFGEQALETLIQILN